MDNGPAGFYECVEPTPIQTHDAKIGVAGTVVLERQPMFGPGEVHPGDQEAEATNFELQLWGGQI